MRNRIPFFSRQQQCCLMYRRAQAVLMLLSLASVATICDPSPVHHPTHTCLCTRLRGGGHPKRTTLDDPSGPTPAWKKLRASDAGSAECLFAEDSTLHISVANERKYRGVRRVGNAFVAASKGRNVGSFPTAVLAGLGYDFHNIATHAANPAARAPVLNFQDARKLFDTEFDAGRDPQVYLAELAAKATREILAQDDAGRSNTQGAEQAAAEGGGPQQIVQISSGKAGGGAAPGMMGFEELRAMARGLGLRSKAEWQRWVRDKRKEGNPTAMASYIEPRERFKESGFTSWEDFLGYEIQPAWQKSGAAAKSSGSRRRKDDVPGGLTPAGESANPLEGVVASIEAEGGEEAAREWREQALQHARDRAAQHQRRAEEDRQLRLQHHRSVRIERSAARFKASNTVTDFLLPGCGWSKVLPKPKSTTRRARPLGQQGYDEAQHSRVRPTILLTTSPERETCKQDDDDDDEADVKKQDHAMGGKELRRSRIGAGWRENRRTGGRKGGRREWGWGRASSVLSSAPRSPQL